MYFLWAKFFCSKNSHLFHVWSKWPSSQRWCRSYCLLRTLLCCLSVLWWDWPPNWGHSGGPRLMRVRLTNLFFFNEIIGVDVMMAMLCTQSVSFFLVRMTCRIDPQYFASQMCIWSPRLYVPDSQTSILCTAHTAVAC